MPLAFEKPRQRRCKAYRQWIATQPCVICHGPSECAHIGPHGLGSKASDFMTLPACRTHHQTARESLSSMTYQAFGEFYGVDVLQMIIEHVSKYIDEMLGLTDNPLL